MHTELIFYSKITPRLTKPEARSKLR